MKRLLVANRGEIAVRIVGPPRTWGFPRSPRLQQRRRRGTPRPARRRGQVEIGLPQATKSYLVIDALVAAGETGAEAVHPGYGFLAERADFAAAVADAGLALSVRAPARSS